MRISELAAQSGVPLPTLKYYLREGLLMPGHAQSRTRADYGPEHLERVRLVRALVEHGGIGISGAHRIIEALDSPPPSRHELLGIAHGALPGAVVEDDAPDPDPSVAAFVERLGWHVEDCAPAIHRLSEAVVRARAAGIDLPDADLERYAASMRAVAGVDLEVAGRAATAADAMHTVVVGTVLVDPVLLALRRLAQEAESAARG